MKYNAATISLLGAMTFFGAVGQPCFGAGAAAGSGGAVASGGGHAAGGGGGGAVNAGGASGGVGRSTGIGQSSPPAGSGTTSTPSAAPATPAASHNAGTGRSGHDHDHRGGYPYGVAYPYSPFGYGYGGDDGNNNNGIVNTSNDQASFDNNNNTGGNVTTDNGTNPAGPQIVTPADPNAASAAAKLQNAADHSPAVLALQAEVQRDQQQYDAARERVLGQLRQQPDYQKAMQARRDAGAQVRSTKVASPNDTNAVVSAAESKLEAGDAVTKMEQYAVDQDPAAAAAKAKLADAMTKLVALRGSAGVK